MKDKGQSHYANSVYTGQNQEKVYKEKKITNKINKKGYRNKPFTEEQKARNKEKSRTMARIVRHPSNGFIENSMHGTFVRTIGIARAKAKTGMINLICNICRCTQLKIVVSPAAEPN